jgi:hypothetical protein
VWSTKPRWVSTGRLAGFDLEIGQQLVEGDAFGVAADADAERAGILVHDHGDHRAGEARVRHAG